MEPEEAIGVLAALAQQTRLDTWRMLVRNEPEGLAAGDIARRLTVPANTLSSHLGVLSRAGLVVTERRSRSIIYRADMDRLKSLVRYLLEDCCGAKPGRCAPLLADLIPSCAR